MITKYGMNDKKTPKSTVQRRDTSVPVVLVGGGAGPTRSSSFDCGSGTVGDQASQINLTTGAEACGDPFQRRNNILRTPTKTVRSQSKKKSKSISTTGWESDDDQLTRILLDEEEGDVFEKQKSKRKRVTTPEKAEGAQELQELREIVEKLSNSCATMQALVDSNPNTKVELKKEITIIGRRVQILSRKCKEWDTLPREIQKLETDPPKIKTVNVGTQTRREDEEQAIDEICADLEKGRSSEDLSKILDLDWPEGAFKVAKLGKGNLMEAMSSKDIAVVIDPQIETDRGFMKTVVNLSPEVSNLLG